MNEDLGNAAADPPPEELMAMIRRRTGELSKSSTLTLKPNGRPLQEILTGESSVTGKVIDSSNGLPKDLPFTLRRVAEDPARFLLVIDNCPIDWNVLAVFLGQFEYWQFPPAVVQVRQDDRPQPLSEGENGAANETYYTLSARGSDDESDDPMFTAETTDLKFTYYPNDGTLDVAAVLPEGSNGETVVAELRNPAGGPRVCRAMHLDYCLPSGRYKKALHAFFPAAKEGGLELVVRPLGNDDLSLLAPDAVQSLLARHDYVSMPVEHTAGGLEFSVRWQDQREAAADPATCWALSVVREGEG
jgi:hypothetical protein